jgi:formylglycine-generating enzyme required for sulfatase activity
MIFKRNFKMKKLLVPILAFSAVLGLDAATIEKVVVRQQWPWSTDIKVEYMLSGVTEPVDIAVTAYNGEQVLDSSNFGNAIRGDRFAVATGGVKSFILDPVAAFGTASESLSDFKISLSVSKSKDNMNEVLYKVFDLTSGECENITRAQLLNGEKGAVETDFGRIGEGYRTSFEDVVIWTGVTNFPKYKTTHLVMRKIPAGSFTMGGHNNTPAISLTISDDFFIGVFEMTQKQCELISAARATAFFSNATYAATRPMEKVSFKAIRGSNGRHWPDGGHAETATPADKTYIKELRDITGNASFDLPQEMYWEYAARAGTQTVWNNGENDTLSGNKNTVIPKLGRTKYTGGWTADATQIAEVPGDVSSENGTAEVGSYAPNAWGLYDIHGNVAEWCIDRYVAWGDMTEDILKNGTTSHSADYHVLRGSSWDNGATKQYVDERNSKSYGDESSSNGWRAFCR